MLLQPRPKSSPGWMATSSLRRPATPAERDLVSGWMATSSLRRPVTPAAEREREKELNSYYRRAKSPMFKSVIPRFGDSSNGTPGPGKYKNRQFNRGPSPVFGPSSKRKFVLQTHNLQPFRPIASPVSKMIFNYDSHLCKDHLATRPVSPTFPKFDRWALRKSDKDNAVPPPGTYKLPVTLKKNKGFKISSQPRFTRSLPKKARVPLLEVKPRRTLCGRSTARCNSKVPSEARRLPLYSSFKPSGSTRPTFGVTAAERNPYTKMEHVHIIKFSTSKFKFGDKKAKQRTKEQEYELRW